ncbi:MAG: Amuc_1100 family pilus-like protein [bacterium]
MQARRRILIIIVAVLLSLLLIGAVTLLVFGFLQFSTVEANLSASKSALESLYTQNPFPSGHNLKQERDNIKTIKMELTGLQLAMGAGQVQPAVLQSRAGFITQFWETQKTLLAGAGGITKVNKTFDFGFGRHMNGALPSNDDVPRLTQQLKIVETLCTILYAAKITALTGISRQEFESDPGSGSGMVKSAPAPVSAPNSLLSSEIEVRNIRDVAAGTIPAGQSYGRWRFVLQFTARESALMNVMNGLSSSPVFIIVTRMEIKGDEKLFDRREGGAVGAKSVEDPVGAGAKEGPKPRAYRTACGRDTMVNVKLELDVYQFVKPQVDDPGKKPEGVR